jgi:hypothetical protein
MEVINMKNYTLKSIFLLYVFTLTFSIFTLAGRTSLAQSIILVDYGSSPSENIYGLEGWNVVLKSSNQVYSSLGPAGLQTNSNCSEFSDYRGISGSSRNFRYGERIVVTWYNTSNQEIRFIPRISFNDPDEPDTGITGTWFTMRDFTNFRRAMITIEPLSSAKSVFNIFRNGINAAAGNHSLVNINLHIEWGEQNELKQYLICDKIELMTDADTLPPQKPTNLTYQLLSDSRVKLNWDIGVDNVSVTDYFIYLDNKIEGYSRTNSFTVSFLEPSKQYTFTITALDQIRNESQKSDPVTITTLPFQGRNDLIRPTDFIYLGAFKFPSGWEFGGDALAYNPQGDGGQSGSGSIDGYPGSLFSNNIDQPTFCYVAEINIPPPIISTTHNPDELNTAINLQPFTNIRPNSINNWTDVDVWRLGLAYLSPRGLQSSPKLYHSWGYHFQLGESKSASLCWCNPSNLADTNSYGGPWYIGLSNGPPYDPALNDYMFSVPQTWADSFTSGRALIIGRARQGGISGLGPTLYAISPWNLGNPPPIFTELNFSKLLEYGSVYNATDTTYPNSILNYNLADDWKGADWLSINNKSAVMIIGRKGLGDHWYGFQGESTPLSWIEFNIPFPDFYPTDPDGKGHRANHYTPMIILYDPVQLAAVASGSINSYEPQPYAALRLDTSIFYGRSKIIKSASFDPINKILYAVEADALQEGENLIHVWKLQDSQTEVKESKLIPTEFKLYQNFPNPFNPRTKIKWQSPVSGRHTLKVFDILGNEIYTLIDEYKPAGIYEVEFQSSTDQYQLTSGVYFYKLTVGKYVKINKMLFIK